MSRYLMGFILIGSLVATIPNGTYAGPNSSDLARVTIRTSPNAEHEEHVDLSDRWVRTLGSSPSIPVESDPVTDRYLTVGGRTYLIDDAYQLYDPASSRLIIPDYAARRELAASVAEAAGRYYGTMATWEEGRQVIGMKGIFTVVDLETGLQFRAQRRAGSTHADVQPLTLEDTTTMKRIYGGRWTWKRRAILVRKDGRVLAASMHGMPHGGDGIPGNGFRGHFCIHFLGSRTHGSGQVDPDHQVMIHKAAGQLRRYVSSASPGKLADLYLTAINQQDPEIAAALFPGRSIAEPHIERDCAAISAIRRVSPDQQHLEADDSLVLELPIRVNIFGRAGTKNHQRMTFHYIREGIGEPWKIYGIQMN
jgi:hypothetical protein